MNFNNLTHGEMFIQKIDKLPELKNAKSHKVKMAVLAHSETGHNHVLSSTKTFTVHEIGEQVEKYLELSAPAELDHKKELDRHENRTLEKGIYKITFKQEYDPWQKAMRRVWD